MIKSSWEQTKESSQYHFDTGIIDLRWDTVIKLGVIKSDWREEVNKIIKESDPITWRSRGMPGYGPRRNKIEFDEEELDLDIQGYSRNHIITNINYDLTPKIKLIEKLFCLEKSFARVHVQNPGQCWNLHIDKLHNWCPEDPSKVSRFMIHLTPWAQGHFMNYGNAVHSQWEVGEVTTFDWQNVPHSTANAGHTPRATLQLTGVRTKETHEFLERLRSGPVEI